MYSLLSVGRFSNIFIFRDNRRPFAALLNITENRWNEIENSLENISSRVSRLRQQLGLKPGVLNIQSVQPLNGKVMKDVVIQADPEFPPYSVQFLFAALSQMTSVWSSVHIHSSLTEIPYHLNDFFELQEGETEKNRSNCKLGITIIWKALTKDPILVTHPAKQISGEVNIIRYFSRILEEHSNVSSVLTHSMKYDSLSSIQASQVDEKLDKIHQITHSESSKDRKILLNKLLNNSNDAISEVSSIPDIALLSVCKQEKNKNDKFLSQSESTSLKAIANRCITKNTFLCKSLVL